MRTAQDRYKTVIFILILLMLGLLFMLPGLSRADQIDDINDALRKSMTEMNALSFEHFGVIAMHRLEVTRGGTVVVDLTSAGLDVGKGTRDQQIGFMIDSLRRNSKGMRKLGLRSITVLIDGTLYESYPLE